MTKTKTCPAGLGSSESLKDFTRSLGSAAKQYTEPQLYRLLKEMNELAELLLDIYLDRRTREKDHPSEK